MRAINPNKPFEFVLDKVRALPEGDPDRPVFLLRTLKPEEFADMKNKLTRSSDMGNIGTVELDTLKLCLCGWRNFRDDEGQEIVFNPAKDEKSMLANIAFIPPKTWPDFVQAITSGNQVGEELRKNF